MAVFSGSLEQEPVGVFEPLRKGLRIVRKHLHDRKRETWCRHGLDEGVNGRRRDARREEPSRQADLETHRADYGSLSFSRALPRHVVIASSTTEVTVCKAASWSARQTVQRLAPCNPW